MHGTDNRPCIIEDVFTCVIVGRGCPVSEVFEVTPADSAGIKRARKLLIASIRNDMPVSDEDRGHLCRCTANRYSLLRDVIRPLVNAPASRISDQALAILPERPGEGISVDIRSEPVWPCSVSPCSVPRPTIAVFVARRVLRDQRVTIFRQQVKAVFCGELVAARADVIQSPADFHVEVRMRTDGNVDLAEIITPAEQAPALA